MIEDDRDKDEDLLGAILAAEDNWKIENALENLGKLLPRRARRCQPDLGMVEDYLRGDINEVRRRGKQQG